MDSTYSRLRALFEQCVELPEGECERWMELHVADTDLRIELELMLIADRGSSGFLHRDVVAHIDQLGSAAEREFEPGSLVGRRFGAFQLQRLIGRGGQGTVYLARRVDSDFEQSAAVKLLRRGIHDTAEHRRFRREREILARFEHAGVARLIDGGVSGDGVPYLIMEYVEGVTIEQWCEDRALDLRARVALFAQLCEVVAAAHRALIVHRDLKPSNVLVAANGAVKVLDFGIARLLDEDDAHTQTLVPLMTPGYGAPEQACGGAITLATDVHALGMLLRLLLTGAAPPITPGQMPPLPELLPAELRWIVGKACRAEPEARYRDAAELAEDITRFLHARPVLAHPPSRWYTARKFVHRHRGGVSVTLALVMITLASLGVALWQAREARGQASLARAEAQRAHAQASRAEAVRIFLVQLFEAAKQRLPRDLRPTPEQLIEVARVRIDNDPHMISDLKASLLTTLAEVSIANSDATAALELLDRARALPDFATRPDIDRLREAAVRAEALLDLDRAEEALPLLIGFEAELAQRVDSVAIDALQARSRANLQLARADEALRDALSVAALARRTLADPSPERTWAIALPALAYSELSRPKEALPLIEAAVGEWRAAGFAQDSRYASLLTTLAVVKFNLGAPDMGAAEQAEALALLRRTVVSPHEKLAGALERYASLLRELGRPAEGEPYAREAHGMFLSLYGAEHRDTLRSLGTLALMLGSSRQWNQAVDAYRQLTATCEGSPLQRDNLDCGNFYHFLGSYLSKLKHYDEALSANARSIEWRRRLLGESHLQVGRALAGRGFILHDMHRYAEAAQLLAEGRQRFVDAGQASSRPLVAIHGTLARCQRALGHFDLALASIESAQALLSEQDAPDPQEQRAVSTVHALLLLDLKHPAEASALAAPLRGKLAEQDVTAEEWRAIQALLQ